MEKNFNIKNIKDQINRRNSSKFSEKKRQFEKVVETRTDSFMSRTKENIHEEKDENIPGSSRLDNEHRSVFYRWNFKGNYPFH